MGLQHRGRSGSCSGSAGDRGGTRAWRSWAETIRGELVELEPRGRAPSREVLQFGQVSGERCPGQCAQKGPGRALGEQSIAVPPATAQNTKIAHLVPNLADILLFCALARSLPSAPALTPGRSSLSHPLAAGGSSRSCPDGHSVPPLTSCPRPVSLTSSPQTHWPPTPSAISSFCSARPPPAAILLRHHCPSAVPHFPPAFPPTSGSCFCLSDLPHSLSWLLQNPLILLPG